MNKAVFAIGVSLVGAWLLAGEGPREQPLVEWKFQDTVLPLVPPVPTTTVDDTSEVACGTCATLACAPKSEQPAGASRGERRVRIVRRLFRR